MSSFNFEDFCTMMDSFENHIDGKIAAAATDNSTPQSKLFTFDNFTRVYVDCINGSDLNDGTSAKPFKTLDMALKKGESISSEFRVHLKTAGVYNTSYMSSSGTTIHINPMCNGATVNFTYKDYNPAIYNAYWHIGKEEYSMAVTADYAEGIYFESSRAVFYNCDVKCRIGFYGGEGHFVNCKTNEIYGWEAKLYFSKHTFDCSAGKCQINNTAGSVFITGTTSIVQLKANSPEYFLYLDGCHVSILSTLKNTSAFKYNNMRLTNSFFTATKARKDALDLFYNNSNVAQTVIVN